MEKITIENIQAEWDIDCEMDGNNLDLESVKSAKLHAKYIDLYTTTKLKLNSSIAEKDILRGNLVKLFNGYMSPQELIKLEWDQWQKNVPNKYLMEELLKGDQRTIDLKLKVEYLEATLYLLDSILKVINGRSFHINNFIKHRSFITGM